MLGVPTGSAVNNLPAMQKMQVRPPRLERSPDGGHSNPLQFSCPEKPMNRGASWATVHRVAKSQT